MDKTEIRKNLDFTIRITAGMVLAFIIAHTMSLEYAANAATITLLTILSTKWDTVKLAINRIYSFILCVALSWIIFENIDNGYFGYFIFILLLVGISAFLGWRSTISVNAVIGTRFMVIEEFTFEFILNEFCLVMIGVVLSIAINAIHNYRARKKNIIEDMRYIEEQLQSILKQMADYLMQRELKENVWDNIIRLENHLSQSLERAVEYQDNTFVSHPEYYIRYIEMRMKQCSVLHNLHYNVKQIRTIPKQAKPLAEYMMYMREYVVEMNVPEEQIRALEEVREYYRKEELPKTREEFEGRAVLYHIMMQLEAFLTYKRRFIDGLEDNLKEIYWKEEKK